MCTQSMEYSSFLSFLLGNSILFLLVRPAYQFFPATAVPKAGRKEVQALVTLTTKSITTIKELMMTFQQFFDHKGEHQCQGSQSCIYCMAGIVFDVTTADETTILILLAITRWRRKNIDHCYLLLVIFHVLEGRSLLETQAVKHKYFGFECGITCIMPSSSLSCATVTTCTTHQKKQTTWHHWTAQLQNAMMTMVATM